VTVVLVHFITFNNIIIRYSVLSRTVEVILLLKEKRFFLYIMSAFYIKIIDSY